MRRSAPVTWLVPVSTSSTVSRSPWIIHFRSLENVVVTPHVGYVTERLFRARGSGWRRMSRPTWQERRSAW